MEDENESLFITAFSQYKTHYHTSITQHTHCPHHKPATVSNTIANKQPAHIPTTHMRTTHNTHAHMHPTHMHPTHMHTTHMHPTHMPTTHMQTTPTCTQSKHTCTTSTSATPSSSTTPTGNLDRGFPIHQSISHPSLPPSLGPHMDGLGSR